MSGNRCPVCGKGELPPGEIAHYRGLIERRAPSPVMAEVRLLLDDVRRLTMIGYGAIQTDATRWEAWLTDLVERLERGE